MLYASANLRDLKNNIARYAIMKSRSKDSRKIMNKLQLNVIIIVAELGTKWKNKEQGPKCFSCNTFGHIASNCMKLGTTKKYVNP